MKGLDLNEELELASGMVNSPRAFIAGGGILLVAYLVGIVIELMKMNSGGKPEWSKPLLRLVMFSALLGSYALVAKGIIMTVSSFGNLQSVNVDTQSIFAARAEAFSRLLAKTSEADLSFAEMASASFVEALMQVGTFFAYAFAAGMIWLIKVLQKVMIATLLSLGPIMIGFAAIPGVTGKYLGAWAFALVEVSAWGITGSVLLRLMNQSFGSLTIDPDVTPNLAEHIVFCLMYAGAFGLIPLITSMILRGAPMANIAMTGQGFAAALPAGAIGYGIGAFRNAQSGGPTSPPPPPRPPGGKEDGPGADDKRPPSGPSTGDGGRRRGDNVGGGASAPGEAAAGRANAPSAAAQRRDYFGRAAAIRNQSEKKKDD